LRAIALQIWFCKKQKLMGCIESRQER
jgi:hypothetical protein